MAKPKWRLAKSLVTLRTQINAAYPNRSKASDGALGDEAHSARVSDHNPNAAGVVTAFDCTHDPAHGCDAQVLADALVESEDPRIKYLILNRRMISSYPTSSKPAWTWRPYSGANPHTKHLHISVVEEKKLYDSTEDWALPHSEEADVKAEPEGTTETIVTKTTETEKPTAGGIQKTVKEAITTVASNESVKTIASEGVSKLATKATTALSTGSTATATGGAVTGKTWLYVLSIVLAVGAVAVILFLLWHKSSKEKQVAVINSDRDRVDVGFE